jgi:hypothetical protein
MRASGLCQSETIKTDMWRPGRTWCNRKATDGEFCFQHSDKAKAKRREEREEEDQRRRVREESHRYASAAAAWARAQGMTMADFKIPEDTRI